MSQIDRRRLLKMTATATVAAGLGAFRSLPALAAESDPLEALNSPEGIDRDRRLPHVPGMRGDRLANELWYTYEHAFYYEPTQEIQDAYQAVGEAFGSTAEQLYQVFMLTRKYGTYPQQFMTRVEPARAAYEVLSRAQLEILDRYCRDDLKLLQAFYLLGEGTLYDPRMPEGYKVHMMNTGPDGAPPMNWHTWHAFNRAMTMLGIAPDRWNRIDQLTGLGWAVQTANKPLPDSYNRPLDRRVALSLIREWGRRTPDDMDVAFDSFPYPPGMS